jgi:sugar O-acyltransferase (sialic acid O-acetyltransferase NeuD family)
MKKVIIVGASGGCLDLLDLILDINKVSHQYIVEGFLDNRIHNRLVCGYKVLGTFDQWREQSSDIFFVTAVGSEKNYFKREKLLSDIPIQRFLTLIHPSAVISKNCEIDQNGVVIHSNVKIGTNAILKKFVAVLSGSIINHDCHIMDYSIINSCCNFSGGVLIGESSYIGAGTIINPNVKIGNKVLVGSGSLVTKNLEDGYLYYGSPALKIRTGFKNE